MADVAQLACTYAALILYDDGQDITGDKIAALVSAAGVKVESYWPKLFAKAVEGQNIASFFNFGGQAASGPAASGPAPVATQAPKEEAKKDDKKAKKEVPPPPKEEEEDGGMGGLFD
jgi:large subunit ribosomal protein LP1